MRVYKNTNHEWGDEFDWKGLSEANDIIDFWCRLGRIGSISKEKWGCRREHISFWDGSLHHLIYPGYCYNQFPQWLWSFDCLYIRPYMPRFIIRLVNWMQIPFYTLGYRIAMKKYPHIEQEICQFAEAPDLIIGGREIHRLHWRAYPGEDDELQDSDK